jgi:hypothetical protein
MKRFFPVVVAVPVFAVCAGGCDSGVDFAAVIEGHAFIRAGGLLGKEASVVVDFSDSAAVTLTAEAKDGDTVTDRADIACDRAGEPEQGAFETRLPADNCVADFEVSSVAELPETPSAIVVGFRNAEDDGSVEIDPSLDEDLPSPFSFADSYSRLDRVD